MELVGRTTIHPALFYSGKVAGYLTWVLLALEYAGVALVPGIHSSVLGYLSLLAIGVGLAFIALSAAHLGRSTRLGLPTGETVLKSGGVYRLSRNPMYVGFHALTIAAVLKTGSVVVLVLGIYSVLVYHRIILGEEDYLLSAFGEQYEGYRNRVRRYF
jgi:protein-S-isoprenylcysteine O-methyltransferase Ste14